MVNGDWTGVLKQAAAVNRGSGLCGGDGKKGGPPPRGWTTPSVNLERLLVPAALSIRKFDDGGRVSVFWPLWF